MNHKLKFLLGWALSGLIISGTANGQQLSYPPVIEGATEAIYKVVDGVELKAWIFQPEHHSPADSVPAIVFFHGGSWASGSPQQFERHARILATRGMVAILADYRVSSRHNTLPEDAVEDAKTAVRMIRQNAGAYGIDPTRVAAAGGSSGGHLAVSTATLMEFDNPGEDLSFSSSPDALVLFNPAVIIAPVEGLWETPAELRAMIGRTDLVSLSPYHHVRGGLSPTLILHGIEDASIPHETVLAYCELVNQLGNRCEVKSYQGAAHGFFNFDPWYEPTVAEMLAFFESLGWLAE